MKKLTLAFIAIILACSTMQAQQELVLPNKIVTLDNPVYSLLDFCETSGIVPFLPMTKPYTRKVVVEMLKEMTEDSTVPTHVKRSAEKYLGDLYRPVGGWIFKQEKLDDSYAIIGAGAEVGARAAMGDKATWATSNIARPFVAGNFGQNITFYGEVGLSIEQLTPDIFYNSYVKNGKVNFNYDKIGYSYHPYQFGFKTMRHHVPASGESGGAPAITGELTAGMIYRGEISGAWFNEKLRLSIHNQKRAWGYAEDNLFLSGRARNFTGLDLIMQPAPWLRYSFLVGSMHAYFSQRDDYKKEIYGYDIGYVQKMLSLHIIELMAGDHLILSATGGNIFSKRFEPSYMVPMLLPHLVQIDVGDHDNLSIGMNIAYLSPKAGKAWFSLFIDEFSFVDQDNLLKAPRNRYAWQLGWNTNIISNIVPGTQLQLGYTRLTPFVYTHYPEEDFKPYSTDRPMDMTYTNDEENLGFYLPPNSAEIKMDIMNVAVDDLVIKMKNRYIIHGTNDLGIDSLMVYGDIYKWQQGNVEDYPLMDFTHDGIYDYTWYSELSADWKIRNIPYIGYFRLLTSIGYSHTRWQANNSGVTAPDPRKLLSASLKIIVDI